jgi:mannose-1-phosphate guanylyltransferase
MQALILAGGEGTRLRPLTYTVPKPVLPLAGRPHIAYVIDWLQRHGIDDVVISCGHLAEGMRTVIPAMKPEVSISYAEEPDARGTAGAIRFAEDLLGDRFLVLNGDILCDLDLSALVAQHEERDATATIALYPVEDPSAYGLVRREPDGAITNFLEKPDAAETAVDTDEINAGAYLLERSVLDLIPPDREVSIEREVFPRMVGGGLYGVRLEGYWIDIGTPERFLQATWDILEGTVDAAPGERIGEGVEIADSATIAERAVIGSGCTIGEEAVIEESVLLSDCTVGARARLSRAILSARVEIAPGASVEAGEVIAEGELVGASA